MGREGFSRSTGTTSQDASCGTHLGLIPFSGIALFPGKVIHKEGQVLRKCTFLFELCTPISYLPSEQLEHNRGHSWKTETRLAN